METCASRTGLRLIQAGWRFAGRDSGEGKVSRSWQAVTASTFYLVQGLCLGPPRALPFGQSYLLAVAGMLP